MAVSRDSRGRFLPGSTPNPKGRPPGVGQYARWRAMLTAKAPDLIRTAIEQAMSGDPAALRLCVERIMPAVREVPVAVEGLDTGSFSERAEAVLRAVGAGELTPGDGTRLLAGIASAARTAEMDELRRRLEALEEAAR